MAPASELAGGNASTTLIVQLSRRPVGYVSIHTVTCTACAALGTCCSTEPSAPVVPSHVFPAATSLYFFPAYGLKSASCSLVLNGLVSSGGASFGALPPRSSSLQLSRTSFPRTSALSSSAIEAFFAWS